MFNPPDLARAKKEKIQRQSEKRARYLNLGWPWHGDSGTWGLAVLLSTFIRDYPLILIVISRVRKMGGGGGVKGGEGIKIIMINYMYL